MATKITAPERQPVPDELARYVGQPGAPLERLRLGIIELSRRREKLTHDALRTEAQCKSVLAAKVLRLYRAGQLDIFQPWDDVAGPGSRTSSAATTEALVNLERQVREARSDANREALAHELAALVAGGHIDPAVAREIRGALTEARHAADAKRQHEPPAEDPSRLLLASAEAMQLARCLDYVASDERRARILAFATAELEADMAEAPTVDLGGVR